MYQENRDSLFRVISALSFAGAAALIAFPVIAQYTHQSSSNSRYRPLQTQNAIGYTAPYSTTAPSGPAQTPANQGTSSYQNPNYNTDPNYNTSSQNPNYNTNPNANPNPNYNPNPNPNPNYSSNPNPNVSNPNISNPNVSSDPYNTAPYNTDPTYHDPATPAQVPDNAATANNSAGTSDSGATGTSDRAPAQGVKALW